MRANNSIPAAVVFGCSGPVLTDQEKRFFASVDPFGFILFARNIVDPQQVRTLVADLRDCIGRGDAPVLIDQEGGRVQRLRPPHWRSAPPGAAFAALADRDPDKAVQALRLNYRLIGQELADLGIDVDCAPVLDVPIAGAHDVIGDRAFGCTPEKVALLGRAVCDGLLDQGILPVIKHIPGHGRAMVDSHLSLPRVDASRDDLLRQDFAPFQALSDQPWAMTAHVVYSALDDAAPATTSAKVVGEVIRGVIGFEGLLISDDLSMKALGGRFEDRTAACLNAGCDVVLHCNGDMVEMQAIASAIAPLSEKARERAAKGRAMKRNAGVPAVQAARQVDEWLA